MYTSHPPIPETAFLGKGIRGRQNVTLPRLVDGWYHCWLVKHCLNISTPLRDFFGKMAFVKSAHCIWVNTFWWAFRIQEGSENYFLIAKKGYGCLGGFVVDHPNAFWYWDGVAVHPSCWLLWSDYFASFYAWLTPCRWLGVQTIW